MTRDIDEGWIRIAAAIGVTLDLQAPEEGFLCSMSY